MDSLARLLIVHWLDPFLPNSTKLSEEIFHLSRRATSSPPASPPSQIPNASPISSQPNFPQKRARFDDSVHPNGNGNVQNGHNSLTNGRRSGNIPEMTSGDLATSAHARNLPKLLCSPQALAAIDSVYIHSIVLPLPLGDLECPLCLRIYWEPDVTPCG